MEEGNTIYHSKNNQMTKTELLEILDHVPDDADVAIDIGEDTMMPICFTYSQLITIKDTETGEEMDVFVLCPCFCSDEPDQQLN